MNILIITPFYKQDKTIGSVRWTKLAPRLAQQHNVTVITQPLDNNSDDIFITHEDGLKVIRCNQQTYYEKFAIKYLNKNSNYALVARTVDTYEDVCQHSDSFIKKIKNRLFYFLVATKAKSYSKWMRNQLKKENIDIDVIISSACPFIVMPFGYELQKLLKCRWICDFRDLPFLEDISDGTHLMRKIMKHQLRYADSINFVTNGIKNIFCDFFQEFKEKAVVITNGFSLAEQREHTPVNDYKLHIVYTGSLYVARFDMLFQAIKNIQARSDFDFCLEYAGGEGVRVVEAAQKYNLESCIIDRGIISRNESMILQNSADLLLLLSYQVKGALPAKIFEYILCDTPILSLTSAPEEKSEITTVVNDLKLGMAVEEVNQAIDLPRLEEYLLKQWQHKCNNEPLAHNPDREKLKRYDHDNLANQFNTLINKVYNK